MITVLPEEEDSDFDLDAPYYIIIGTGENPGTNLIIQLVQQHNLILYLIFISSNSITH